MEKGNEGLKNHPKMKHRRIKEERVKRQQVGTRNQGKLGGTLSG